MPKRTYMNAGGQTQQGWYEARFKYYESDDETLFTVKCISLVLGIRLQMVKQIPVQRIMIDKRGYYRKGDIRAWMEADLGKPDSLLRKMMAEHAITKAKLLKHPSKRYNANKVLSKEEAAQAKEKTKTSVLKEPDAYEALWWPGSLSRVKRLKNRNKS